MNRLLQSFVSNDSNGKPQQQPPRSNGSGPPAPFAHGHHANTPVNYGPPSLPANEDQYETLDLDAIGTGQQQAHQYYPPSGPRSGNHGVTYARQQDNGPFSAQYTPYPSKQQHYASSTDSYFDQSGLHQQSPFAPQSGPPHEQGPSGHYHSYDHPPQASPPSFPPQATSFFSHDHHAPAPLSSSSSSASHNFFTDQSSQSSASDLFGSSDGPSGDFLTAAPASYAPQASPRYTPAQPFGFDSTSPVTDAADLFGTPSSDAFHTPVTEQTPVDVPPAPVGDSSVELPPSAADLFGSPQRSANPHFTQATSSPAQSPVRNPPVHVRAAFSSMQLNSPDYSNPPSPPKPQIEDKPTPPSPVGTPVTPQFLHQTPPSPSRQQPLTKEPSPLKVVQRPPHHELSPPSISPTSSNHLDVSQPVNGDDHAVSSSLPEASVSSVEHTKQLMLQYKHMAERLEHEKNELLDILTAQADQFYAMQAYIDQLVADKAATLAP
ncbi:hypothetical protein H257_04630 [Aphanomyces astaci]|uniref:Uncharacterized protein n=2 Tax=Aphanomyces astaci TaxID=112090 RepID=W4GVA2_APHAT|nr:hypothetical protein H257_04630 [Aphanomyces astaci]ETV82853.1 hypothetical protein H257_04630 [Aphanomyces astaci]|eukprot:XP_009827524.1 hypothetical protein H257_04630 [Aphanomyces astaci]